MLELTRLDAPRIAPIMAAERERVSVSNLASTMVAMLVNNPLLPSLDLTSLRVLSCGGSPQTPAIVRKAIAVFGCEFFVSYGKSQRYLHCVHLLTHL